VLDRVSQLEAQTSALRESAGAGTVAGNLTTALTTPFGPVPVAIIPLIFRDELELDGTCVPVAGAFMGARRHAGGYAGNRRRRW